MVIVFNLARKGRFPCLINKDEKLSHPDANILCKKYRARRFTDISLETNYFYFFSKK